MSNETPSPATLAGPRSPEAKGGHGSTSSGPTTTSGRVNPDGHAGPVNGGGVSKETRRRVIAASFIGNFVEWFGYAVYGYLAATIAAVFFPDSNPQTGLLLTFSLFALSFLVPPFAGFFGCLIGARVCLPPAPAMTSLTMP